MPEHAALITAIILDRPTCLACIAANAQMSLSSVSAYLEQIAGSVMVHQAPMYGISIPVAVKVIEPNGSTCRFSRSERS